MNRRLVHRTRRLALPLLAALWLCAQALGLAHRSLHLPLPAAVAHATPAGEGAFGHDEGGLDCRLYDQLAHADVAFGVAAPAVATAAHDSVVVAVQAGRSVAPPAAFLARGPPAGV